MNKYKYWWHDGKQGFIFADECKLEGNEWNFYIGGQKIYEMPAWMVKDVELVKAEKAARKVNE